jgi:hypothetical protein
MAIPCVIDGDVCRVGYRTAAVPLVIRVWEACSSTVPLENCLGYTFKENSDHITVIA